MPLQPDHRTETIGGDLGVALEANDRVQHLADVAGHGGGLNRAGFAAFDQPAIEGQGEGALAGLDPRVQGREGVDPDDWLVGLEAIQAALAATITRCGPSLKPIWADRDLCAEARRPVGSTPKARAVASGWRKFFRTPP